MTNNRLTNRLPPLTVAQTKDIIAGKLYEPVKNVAAQLLATMQENERLRTALATIERGTYMKEGMVGVYTQTIDYTGIRETARKALSNEV